MTDLQTIKSWFRTRCKPTEAQFHEVFDSFWHKAEGIGITAINGLMEILNSKAAANHNHDGVYQPAGNYASADHTHSQYLTQHQDVSTKADIVENPVNGNFAGLDAEGNLTDSGHAPTDFASANHNHDNVYATVGHTHSQYLTQHQDISGKASKVQRVAIAANNHSVTLQPNTLYYTPSERRTSLEFELATPSDNTIANEYRLIIEIGSSNATIYLPDDIMWAGGDVPAMEVGCVYDIRICENIGSYLEVVKSSIEIELIDLGLPSGTLWAKYNIGVDPTDLRVYSDWYGARYAWGEVRPKSEYYATNYQYGESELKGLDSVSKYCPSSDSEYWGGSGQADNLTILQPEDDVAFDKYGEDYHLPSPDQFEELFNTAYVTVQWVDDYNGVSELCGALITSKSNGNSIFLPNNGPYGGDVKNLQIVSGYWSNELDDWENAQCLFLSYLDDWALIYAERYYGLYVRAVYNPQTYESRD